MKYKLENVIFIGAAEGGFQGNNGWIPTTDINLVHNETYQDRGDNQRTSTKQFKVTAGKEIADKIRSLPINSKITIVGKVTISRNGGCFCSTANWYKVESSPDYSQTQGQAQNNQGFQQNQQPSNQVSQQENRGYQPCPQQNQQQFAGQNPQQQNQSTNQNNAIPDYVEPKNVEPDFDDDIPY